MKDISSYFRIFHDDEINVWGPSQETEEMPGGSYFVLLGETIPIAEFFTRISHDQEAELNPIANLTFFLYSYQFFLTLLNVGMVSKNMINNLPLNEETLNAIYGIIEMVSGPIETFLSDLTRNDESIDLDTLYEKYAEELGRTKNILHDLMNLRTHED